MDCGCSKKTMRASGSGHTDGTTTPVFTVLTGPIDIADYESVKIDMEVLDISNAADAQVGRGMQTSNDGVTWDAATAIGSATSTEGWDYGASYTTLNVAKRYVRFGLLTKQTSGAGASNNENVRANLVISLAPR